MALLKSLLIVPKPGIMKTPNFDLLNLLLAAASISLSVSRLSPTCKEEPNDGSQKAALGDLFQLTKDKYALCGKKVRETLPYLICPQLIVDYLAK